jgi:Kef-type K+ transport system membrane component KefB
MAATVQITDRGRTAKVRNPWAVLLFTVITLGVYYLVWYYKINREMSDWGEQHRVDIGMSPGMSVLAVTLGAILIIPPFVSIWGTGKRMQLTQRAANVHGGSGLLWFVMHIIPIVSLFAPVYLQYQLNQAWETQPAVVFGAPVAAAA